MNKIKTTLFFLVIYTGLFAQSRILDDFIEKIERYPINYKNAYDGIDGSPYLNKEFTEGKIVLTDSSEIRKLSLRYDWYAKEMELKRDGKLLIIPEDKRIKYIRIGDIDYLPFHFSKEIDGYLVLLYSNKSLLLKKESVEFLKEKKPETVTDEYKPPRFKWSEPQYYTVINNNDFNKLVLFKKKFVLSFPEETQSKLLKFIKNEKISLKKEDELIKVFEYFDSIY